MRRKATGSRTGGRVAYSIRYCLAIAFLYTLFQLSKFGFDLGLSSSSPPITTLEVTSIAYEFPNKDIFLPGTLDLPRHEVLSKCYINPITYKDHMHRRMCTYSKKYDLFYILIPKSGSSTGRKIFKLYFNSSEYNKVQCGNYMFGVNRDVNVYGATNTSFRVASLRDPFSRYFSSFDEMLYRRITEGWNRLPKNLSFLKEKFEGISLKDFSNWLRTPTGEVEILELFENFVLNHDFQDVFDVHLSFQAPAFSTRSLKGRTVPFQRILSTTKMIQEIRELAQEYKITSEIPDKVARKRNRYVNVENVSDETVLKICQKALIDFCCLNYELPPECLKNNIQPGQRPRCQWQSYQGIADRLIEPTFI